MNAVIHEIFSSLQGEGTHVGAPMTFVRFQGCALRCQWCDTPAALAQSQGPCRVESPPRSQHFASVANPLSIAQLAALLTPFDDDTIALTGGEPLEQARFIADWLATAPPRRKILLETSGVMTAALATVLPYIDIVSMDIKLPSSTNMRPYWEQHADFLRAARAAKKETYCKIVVTGHTLAEEVMTAAQLIRDIDPSVPMILQPVHATAAFDDTTAHRALQIDVQRCRELLPQVRVIPQMHKILGLL